MTATKVKEPVEEVLVDDGTGNIYFWIPEGSKEAAHFMLGVADDGGYSSVFMSKKTWEGMKAKVDELIASHVLEVPKCVMCLAPSVRVCGKGTIRACNYPLCNKCEHPHE